MKRRNDNITVTNNLDIFRQEFLGANTWAQRKDGVPLELLDKLSRDELETAELELINAAGLHDDWPIRGLGHIKSAKALPILYELLGKTKKGFKVIIAYSIFQVCNDREMIEIVLEELPGIPDQYELIDLLYLLPAFRDEKITTLLNDYRNHQEYLVAYNATRALGLSTAEVVNKFRRQGEDKKLNE